MPRTATTTRSQPASIAGIQSRCEPTTDNLFQSSTRTVFGHSIFCIGVFVIYLLLNQPEVILLSRLGLTAWYPAVGLAFAIMLAISPRYMPLFAVAGSTAGMLFYHQSFFSWGTLVGVPLEIAAYAAAAYLLRGPLRIDSSLGQRRDVLRYVVVASAGAILATLAGVICLCADHTIEWSQFWGSALDWYIGDSIGLLSVAPFLLIHVLPWVCKRNAVSVAESVLDGNLWAKGTWEIAPLQILEVTCQAASFGLLFWIMFGLPEDKQLFYPAFLPIIWMGMRRGIRGAVAGLLALNFGIVVTLRFVPVSGETFTKLGLLMLSVSATGLILGAAVSERERIARDLKEHTVFLNSLIENSPFGIVVHDRDGKVQLHNDAFAALFHYNTLEIVGKNLRELVVPADQHHESLQLAEQVNSGQTIHETVRRRRKDGQLVDLEIHALPMVVAGRVQGGYVIYKDISEEVRASVVAQEHAQAMGHWVGELELRTMQITQLNEMSGLLQCAESTEEAFAVIRQSVHKLFADAGAGAVFIYKPSGNVLELTASWGDGGLGEPVFARDACWSLRLGKPHWSESSNSGIVCGHIDRTGESIYLCVPMVAQSETLGVLHLRYDLGHAGIPHVDPKTRESQTRLAVAAASQIAVSLANLRLRETLREQSIRDPLTGLFNRRFMQESLNKELQRARRKDRLLSLIFLDLDHFKRFNDVFGHDAGDSVLQSMADIFRMHFRAEDIICRYGGEEFAIILPESSVHDALKRADALRLATKDLKLVHRGVLLDPVTLSIGIAGFPENGENAQDLLDAADKSLYQSKANGRDRVTLASS
ncbi:MAG TPA: diguanylate cyclase [Candidatus Acidoferrum sp.]|nr:diguanylate cyclase [Candidatus Acidoferrum sp.]